MNAEPENPKFNDLNPRIILEGILLRISSCVPSRVLRER